MWNKNFIQKGISDCTEKWKITFFVFIQMRCAEKHEWYFIYILFTPMCNNA